MGKHSAGSDRVFFRTLFLSVLKWGVAALIAVSALVGGWTWLSNRNEAATPAEDDPAMIDPDGSGATSAGPTPGETGAAQILNGAADPQLTEAARKKLEDAGYEVLTTGVAAKRYDQTMVFYQEGNREAAQDLVRLVGANLIEAAPDNLDPNIPLTLVIGADFIP